MLPPPELFSCITQDELDREVWTKKKAEAARSLVRYDTKAWAERRRREEATTGWSETGGGET